jgi:hypothetical protein
MIMSMMISKDHLPSEEYDEHNIRSKDLTFQYLSANSSIVIPATNTLEGSSNQ